MDIKHLDRLVPRRWVLWLYYYLPFFKKPTPLHFELRQFINQKKIESNTQFDRNTLFDLLLIIDKCSKTNVDKTLNDFIVKIIVSVIFYQKNFIAQSSIATLIDKFDSKISDALLCKFLNLLPKSLFQTYIDNLNKGFIKSKNTKLYYEKHIKYFEKLKHKFTSSSKLIFFILVPYDFIADKCKNLEQLLGLEALFLMKFLKFLYSELGNNLFSFILKWKIYVNENNDVAFYNGLLNNEEGAVSILKENFFNFYKKEKNNFFNEALIPDKNIDEDLIRYFLDFNAQQQSFAFVNKVILDYFSLLNENPLHSAIFKFIEQNIDKYPLNLFQALAIFYATKKPININALAKKNPSFSLEKKDLEAFSPQIQLAVLEYSLACVQCYINNMIIEKVDTIPEEFELKILWKKIFPEDNPNTDQPHLIKHLLPKIPQKFKILEKDSLNLFQALYYYLNTSNLKKLVDPTCVGKTSKISYQQMNKIFGKEAKSMVENWQKSGVTFFDARYEEATNYDAEEMHSKIISFSSSPTGASKV